MNHFTIPKIAMHGTFLFKTLYLHILLTFFNGLHSKSSAFTLKLIPWDSPESPLYQPNLIQSQKIQMMTISSKARATISPTPKNGTALIANKIQIPVHNDILRYSVNIKIGSPGTEVTLLLDTGSGAIWTQCKRSKSHFNPNKSKTYRALPYQNPLCQKAKDLCRNVTGKCVCTLRYGIEGGIINQVKAVLSSDSFTLPLKNKSSKTFTNMVFGCTTQSPVFSGILGLNKLPVSLISQVRENVRGRYSYCLHQGHGYLTFGNDIPKIDKDVKTTPILYPSTPAMYLGLSDISVADKRLGLSPALFSKAQGGFVIDTGSPLTVLKKQAYDRVIRAFANYYDTRLERAKKKIEHPGLCYRYNSSMKSEASMTFHLQGGDYVTSSLYVSPEPDIICIGLIPGERSILGALQQWNKRFIFDINTNVLKFVSEDCSKDRG